jgi:hypothetical protein
MKVINRYDGVPEGATYVGRGSRWGNPFVIGRDGDRAEVIAKYREYAIERIGVDKNWLVPLIGSDLICFCAPLPCHADVLIEMIGE